MKKFILLIATMVLLTIALTACSKSESQGLDFESNGDGTCSVIGIGTCADTDLVIPEKSPDGDMVTSIGDNAFQHCDNITTLSLPESLTEIGKSAFDSLENLKEVTIPKNVTKIGDYAFGFCKSLETVTIEGEIEELSFYPFSHCDNLNSVNLKHDFIYYHAFISDIEKGYSLKLYMDIPSESVGIIDEITEENRNDIYCRYFNKDKMILNEEEITLHERKTIGGHFKSEIKNISLEFNDGNKCKIYGNNQLFAECTYTYDNNEKLFVIEDEKASLKVMELDEKYIYVEGKVMESGNEIEVKADLTKDVKV